MMSPSRPIRSSVFSVLLAALGAAALVAGLIHPGAGAVPWGGGGGGAALRFDGHALVRVTIRSEADLRAMSRISPDCWSENPGIGEVDFRVAPGGIPAIEEAGLEYRVLVDDLQPLVERQRARPQGGTRGWYDAYRTYDEILQRMDDLVAQYPQLAQVQEIGLSVEGRSIRALRVSAPGGERPSVVYTHTQHAREWISSMAAMFTAEQLLAGYGSDPYLTTLLDRVVCYFVPVCNPDGFDFTWTTDRMWRKNRRDNGDGTVGVDLNRNWDAGWGGEGSSGDPGSNIYRGPSPFSEPETRAARDLMLSLGGLAGHIDIHSYSQLVLQPYGYTGALPPDHAVLDLLGGRMVEAMTGLYGKSYVHGPIYTTIYPASGSATDWSYDATPALGFAFELRDQGEYGFLLPPEQIVPASEESMAGALELAQWAATRLEFAFPDGRPAYVEPGIPASIRVEITPVNGGVYEEGTGGLWWRAGSSGDFTGADLLPLGGDLFEGELPPAPCGIPIQYYFEASTTDGTIQRAPFAAPLDLFETQVAEVTVVFADDFETDRGWTVENVDLTSGAWERGVPAGGGARGDPPADGDGSGRCFLTENAAGDSDVDGGPTRLVSPLLDLAAGDPVVRYSFWMYNDDGDDSLLAEVSNDDGVTWTTARTYTGGGGGWVQDGFRVGDLIAPTSRMRFRFAVADNPNDSVTEAGLDAFDVSLIDCREPVIVLDPVALVRGQAATFTVSGALPGSEVHFFYTKHGTGAGPCDPFYGGLCFDLLPPVRRFAIAIADASGVASRTKTVPPGAPLRTFHLQAVDRIGGGGESSVKSNVVEATVTQP